MNTDNGAGGSYSVLVVDDEPENLDLLSRTLGFDYEVHCASSGEEALAKLRDIPALALIITDQRMPGMFGTELLRRARLLRADTVRIILTGFTDARDLIDAINSSNVYRFMTKPWDIEQLRAVVHRAVRLYAAGGDELVCDVTGLPRAGLFQRELEREVFRARSIGGKLRLVSIELAGYAEYSESAGIVEAEQILRTVADELRTLVEPLDIVCVRGEGKFLVCAVGEKAFDERRAVNAIEQLASFAEARRTAPTLRVVARSVALGANHHNAAEMLHSLEQASTGN